MADHVAITIAGQPCDVVAGTSAAGAFLQTGLPNFRRSVTGEPRGPVCGMGICQECRLTINGESHVKSCQVLVEPGMAVDMNAAHHAIDNGLSKDLRERQCDVLVVGAGPGGIAAALTAAECGKSVGLIDDNPDVGGQIWRGERHTPTHADAKPWLNRLQSAKVERMNGASVVASPTSGTLLAVERGRSLRLRYRKLILATGARERFLPFPGWTLPGVMGVGGLQALVKSGLPIAGKKIVIVGTGPLLLAVAAHLKSHGADIRLIAEQTSFGKLGRFTAKLLLSQSRKITQALALRWNLRGVPYHISCWATAAAGEGRVQSVTLTNGKRTWVEPCDYLACGFGLVANLELPRLLQCAVVGGYVQVDELQQSTVPDIFAVGELTGVGGVDKALIEGRIAGLAAGGQFDRLSTLHRSRDRLRRFCQLLDRTFELRDELRNLPANDTFICRCEDVSHGRLRQFESVREAKLHTRCGMGACQGRVCGTAAEFLYGWGADTIRPPLSPCKVGDLAGIVGPK